MGKGKAPQEEASEHVSRPLNTLKDPSSFGPPPKNVNYHGGAALPNQITPDRRGLGAPLSEEEIRTQEQARQEELRSEEEKNARGPPIPYRANTTGLATDNLPLPPTRRLESPVGAPPKQSSKPSLPPRLPPRQNSNPTEFTPAPPPDYGAATNTEPAQLNKGSLNRLGKAGVSVPGFNIGGGSNPWSNEPSRGPSPASPNSSGTQNELQSRFARMSTTSPRPESSTEGTTLGQKQAAFKTAQSFHKDPSSVSLSDARSAASTANNFRERHGEQVASGMRSANGLNQKYGITNRLNSFASGGSASPKNETPPPLAARTSSYDTTAAAGKKKPPPPPPKKSQLQSSGTTSASPVPPPLPLSSKPRF